MIIDIYKLFDVLIAIVSVFAMEKIKLAKKIGTIAANRVILHNKIYKRKKSRYI